MWGGQGFQKSSIRFFIFIFQVGFEENSEVGTGQVYRRSRKEKSFPVKRGRVFREDHFDANT